jgi:septum formation protein
MASSADPARSALVLASASPRRRWLLSALGIPFEVLAVDIDERPRAGETPAAFARRMAEEKARAAGERRALEAHARPVWVLAADTIVELDGHIFGKPDGEDGAAAMLRALAGRTHVVRTAMCLLEPGGALSEEASVTTEVGFRALDPEAIDKAGAYAIQGEGAHLVSHVSGSFTNVIGLPLEEVAAWLRARGLL